jgi:hypothetical protein
MVTGSIASSMQGHPRATHDIDLLVDVPESAIPRLVEAFPPPGFHLDEESVRNAVRDRRMFNLLRVKDGDKVDFWLVKDTPFDRSRFARKQLVDVEGIRLKVSSPEDTILAKLDWARRSGGSEKQMLDAIRVYEVQFGALDRAYLADWVKRLGVEALWRRVQQEARTI